MSRLLENGRFLFPSFEVKPGKMLIKGESIAELLAPSDPSPEADQVIDLGGRVVFPALINAHDHLFETFWPRFEGGPFKTWLEYERALKDFPPYRAKRDLSISDLYALGMYRNVLSGVGLVVDHFPREVSSTFCNKPMISLLEHCFVSHSLSTGAPEWGEGVREEFKQARGVLPFIIHVEEGFEPDLTDELDVLSRIGGLNDNTVLVGGIGLSDADIGQMASRKSSFVWIPDSDRRVFGAVAPIGKILDAGIRVALGTDCVMKGSLNLFEELRGAAKFSEEQLAGRLQTIDLLKMVTTVPAEMFRVEKYHGSLSVGRLANLLIFEDRLDDPFKSFLALTPRDISLQVHRGSLVYGDEGFRNVCILDFNVYSEVLVDGRPKIIWGKPLQLLERIEHKLGEARAFPFLPVTEP